MAEKSIMQFRYIDFMLKAFQFFQQFNISSCLIHDVIQSVLIVVWWENRLCTSVVWTFQDKRFTRVDKLPMHYRSYTHFKISAIPRWQISYAIPQYTLFKISALPRWQIAYAIPQYIHFMINACVRWIPSMHNRIIWFLE